MHETMWKDWSHKNKDTATSKCITSCDCSWLELCYVILQKQTLLDIFGGSTRPLKTTTQLFMTERQPDENSVTAEKRAMRRQRGIEKWFFRKCLSLCLWFGRWMQLECYMLKVGGGDLYQTLEIDMAHLKNDKSSISHWIVVDLHGPLHTSIICLHISCFLIIGFWMNPILGRNTCTHMCFVLLKW